MCWMSHTEGQRGSCAFQERRAGLGRGRGITSALEAAWERLQRAALCWNMVWFDGISWWELARGLAGTVLWGCHCSTCRGCLLLLLLMLHQSDTLWLCWC